MSKARVGYRVTVVPISKPLSCWLVCHDDPKPWGPHEVHAMAVIVESASDEAQVSGRRAVDLFYDVPAALNRQADSMFCDGIDLECSYYIPSAQTGDGDCWWTAKMVSFTEEGCVQAHERLKEEYERGK